MASFTDARATRSPMPTAAVTPANLKKALNAIDPSLVDQIRNVGADAATGAVDARELALVANAVRGRRSTSANAANEADAHEEVARALSYVILTSITWRGTLATAVGKRAKTNADRAVRDAPPPQWKDLKPHIKASFAARTALRIHTQPVGDANACDHCDGAASLQTQRQQIYMTDDCGLVCLLCLARGRANTGALGETLRCAFMARSAPGVDACAQTLHALEGVSVHGFAELDAAEQTAIAQALRDALRTTER